MKTMVLISLLCIGVSAVAEEMKTPKEECEELMNDLMPFAEKMLIEYGGFHPFGGKLLQSGEIIHVGAHTGVEHPPSIELIETMRKAFTQESESNTLKATAIVFDVLTIPPGSTEKTDAIQVDLNHREGYRVSVLFLYEISDGAVQYGRIFAIKLDFSPFGETDTEPSAPGNSG